jgi:hypothetical protein
VLTVGVAALGVIPVATPASAAPTPTTSPTEAACAAPERYAAEANAELLRLNRLDLRPAGRTEAPVTAVGLATSRSALVAQSPINSAAAARMLDGRPSGRTAPASLTRPLYQQAPPTNRTASRVAVAAQQVGPVSTGRGRLTSHARWEASMACGGGSGEVTAAQATMDGATILTDSDDRSLVAVPHGLQSLSQTALDRRGANVHTVARASVTMREIRLLADAVRVTMVEPPHLQTSISASGGSAEVRYSPPTLEVSGQGFATQRLDAPGDAVELALGRDGRTESVPAVPGEPLRKLLAAVPTGALSGLIGGNATKPDLPGLPERPGVPTVPGGRTEADDEPDNAGGAGEMVRISIGDVRQAAAGHAVAARAIAVHVQVVAGPSASGPGGVVLDLDLGVLEAAAVAPDPGTDGGAGAQADAAGDGGAGGRLPVTGPGVDRMVLAGGALLIIGAAFLWVGLYGIRRARRDAPS